MSTERSRISLTSASINPSERSFIQPRSVKMTKPSFPNGKKPYYCSSSARIILLTATIKSDAELIAAAKQQGIELAVTLMSDTQFAD